MRRWILRVGVVLVALLLLAGAVGVVTLHNLERPFFRRPLQALVLRTAGVEVGYDVARVTLWSGAHLENVTVAQPAPLQRFAPELVRIRRLELEWSLGRLWRSRIEQVVASGVELTLVEDKDGRGSLDPALPQDRPKPPSSTPSSHLEMAWLGLPLPVARVEVEDLRLNRVREQASGATERTSVQGLALRLSTRTHAASLVASATPLKLTTAKGQASLDVQVGVEASTTDVAVQMAVRIREQTLVAQASVAALLELEANAHFEPTRRATGLRISHAKLGNGAASLELEATLWDTSGLSVARAELTADVERALALVPADLPLPARGKGRVHAQVKGLELAAIPRWAAGGGGHISLDLRDLQVGVDRVGEVNATLDAGPFMDAKLALRLSDATYGSATLKRLRAGAELQGLAWNRLSPLASTGTLELEGSLRLAPAELSPRRARTRARDCVALGTDGHLRENHGKAGAAERTPPASHRAH